MDFVEAIERAIGTRKDTLILLLQGLTAVGVLLTIVPMIHVGPLTTIAPGDGALHHALGQLLSGGDLCFTLH